MNTTENNLLDNIKESFGLIFLLERRLEYMFDKVLESDNLTAKQFLVLATIVNTYREKPSIQEVAKQLLTSHQNVKAIALNLQKQGFVTLEKDRKDKRVTRLTVTPKSKAFWQKREAEDKSLLHELFKHLSDQEVSILHQSLIKLFKGADELIERINIEKERSDEDL